MQALPLTNTQQASPDIPGKLLGRLLRGMPELQWITEHHAKRKEAESYIAGKFHQEHHAQIKDFMPYLLTISCLGNFTAAVGLRSACNRPLFVEHYLEQSAFQLVCHLSQDKSLQPQHIIELGNLVSTQRGSSQLLFVLLTALLHQADVRWVVFTASGHVQTLLKKLGLACITVCQADKHRLPDGGATWGRYYDNNPCVTIIHIPDAIQTLYNSRISAALIHAFTATIGEQAKTLHHFIQQERVQLS